MRENESPVIVITEEEVAPIRPRYRPSSPWPARSLGAGVTLIVHVLLSAPLVLGYDAHRPRDPSDQGAGSVAWASQGDQVESMILLDLSAIAQTSSADTPELRIDAEGITPEEMKLELVSVDPSPPPELQFEEADDAEVANEASGDPAGNAALFGRYMGQISARIERAWLRPRSPVAGGHFDCRARISQDRSGKVLDIQLHECSADPAWRKSLESAIRLASPLSSPPEPWLFTSTLTLTFTGDQFVEGTTPEYHYEPVVRRVAAHDSSVAQPAMLGPGNEAGDFVLTNDGDRLVFKKTPSVATPK